MHKFRSNALQQKGKTSSPPLPRFPILRWLPPRRPWHAELFIELNLPNSPSNEFCAYILSWVEATLVAFPSYIRVGPVCAWSSLQSAAAAAVVVLVVVVDAYSAECIPTSRVFWLRLRGRPQEWLMLAYRFNVENSQALPQHNRGLAPPDGTKFSTTCRCCGTLGPWGWLRPSTSLRGG